MPKFTLPIGFEIPSLKADINERCCQNGQFHHNIEHYLGMYRQPETREKARFRITQICIDYTTKVMQQFPDLQAVKSGATLAMEIRETLIHQITQEQK